MWVPLVGFSFRPSRIHRRRGSRWSGLAPWMGPAWLGLAGLPALEEKNKKVWWAWWAWCWCFPTLLWRAGIISLVFHHAHQGPYSRRRRLSSPSFQASKDHYRSSWHPCGTLGAARMADERAPRRTLCCDCALAALVCAGCAVLLLASGRPPKKHAPVRNPSHSVIHDGCPSVPSHTPSPLAGWPGLGITAMPSCAARLKRWECHEDCPSPGKGMEEGTRGFPAGARRC